MISQSSLEILGEVKLVIREMENGKVISADEFINIKKFIAKYW